MVNSSKNKHIKIKKLKKGFRVHYIVLNQHFSEYDNGKSYLEPVNKHIDFLWQKITGHYLIYSEQFFGLRVSRKNLAIIDECPKKELRKRCLEEIQKFLKNF